MTTYHHFIVQKKYTYTCGTCQHRIGRHSKSINVDTQVRAPNRVTQPVVRSFTLIRLSDANSVVVASRSKPPQQQAAQQPRPERRQPSGRCHGTRAQRHYPGRMGVLTVNVATSLFVKENFGNVKATMRGSRAPEVGRPQPSLVAGTLTYACCRYCCGGCLCCR